MSAEQCEWEWNGTRWNLISGPSGCMAPMPPRDPPGTRLVVECPEIAKKMTDCCSGSQCCETVNVSVSLV